MIRLMKKISFRSIRIPMVENQINDMGNNMDDNDEGLSSALFLRDRSEPITIYVKFITDSEFRVLMYFSIN